MNDHFDFWLASISMGMAIALVLLFVVGSLG